MRSWSLATATPTWGRLRRRGSRGCGSPPAAGRLDRRGARFPRSGSSRLRLVHLTARVPRAGAVRQFRRPLTSLARDEPPCCISSLIAVYSLERLDVGEIRCDTAACQNNGAPPASSSSIERNRAKNLDSAESRAQFWQLRPLTTSNAGSARADGKIMETLGRARPFWSSACIAAAPRASRERWSGLGGGSSQFVATSRTTIRKAFGNPQSL